MNIGKKIKELRTEKLMTQSELAGAEITRNMLSRIENEAALPSLGTVLYLAERLGVPAGYLLSEGDEVPLFGPGVGTENVQAVKSFIRKHIGNKMPCLDTKKLHIVYAEPLIFPHEFA